MIVYVVRDQTGTPVSVYEDYDEALKEADEYDYYVYSAPLYKN
jgi:hypothetical protein